MPVFVDGSPPTVTTSTSSIDNSNHAIADTVTIDVSYSDNFIINDNFQPGDLQITGPNSTHFTPTSASTLVSGNNPQVAYTVTIPNNINNSGAYIATTTGTVTDFFGNPIAVGTQVDQFSLDFTPPTVALDGTPTITKETNDDNVTVNVRYLDNTGFAGDPSHGEVQLIPPAGSPILPFTQASNLLVPMLLNGDYQFSVPNDPANTGTYMIADTGGLADTSGNVLSPTILGSVSFDFTPPTGAVTTPASFTPGAASGTFQVTYTDNVAVNTSNLAESFVTLVGPHNYFKADTGATAISTDPAVVEYTFAAPDGSFDAFDDGTYQVFSLLGIADSSGNALGSKRRHRLIQNPPEHRAPVGVDHPDQPHYHRPLRSHFMSLTPTPKDSTPSVAPRPSMSSPAQTASPWPPLLNRLVHPIFRFLSPTS